MAVSPAPNGTPRDRAPGGRESPAVAGAASDGDAGGLRLRLYVAGAAPNSVRARANLEAVMERCGVAPETLDVVDCLREPRRALADGVLVTPTLVRVAPDPRQVIVGSLTDTPRVLSALGLEACAEEVASRAL